MNTAYPIRKWCREKLLYKNFAKPDRQWFTISSKRAWEDLLVCGGSYDGACARRLQEGRRVLVSRFGCVA